MKIEEVSMMLVFTWVVMALLFGYCLHLQSRLNSQAEWLMNHSSWLKAHSNWLKALTIMAKNGLPEEINENLSEFILRTPEETIQDSIERSDNQWCNE